MMNSGIGGNNDGGDNADEVVKGARIEGGYTKAIDLMEERLLLILLMEQSTVEIINK